MALVMTEAGHIAIAAAMKNMSFYLGVGGLPDDYPNKWAVTDKEIPPFDPNSTELILPFGYKKAQRVVYVVEDNINGSIVFEDKRYSESQEPTSHLYIEFLLDTDEVVDKVIYQLGLFINLQPNPSLPPGQLFFTPDQVVDTGILYIGENVKPIYKQSGVKEIYSLVLNF